MPKGHILGRGQKANVRLLGKLPQHLAHALVHGVQGLDLGGHAHVLLGIVLAGNVGVAVHARQPDLLHPQLDQELEEHQPGVVLHSVHRVQQRGVIHPAAGPFLRDVGGDDEPLLLPRAQLLLAAQVAQEDIVRPAARVIEVHADGDHILLPGEGGDLLCLHPGAFPRGDDQGPLAREGLFQLGQGSPAPVPFHILQVQLLGIGPVKAAPLFRSHGVEDLINILHREGVLLREE